MRRLVFLIDVDEVLADFVSPAISIMSDVLGRPWTLDEAPKDNWDMFSALSNEERVEVHARMQTQGFCSQLKPLPGAQDFVRELRAYRDVYAVTSPLNSPFWVYERDQWLGDFFGFDRKHVVHTEAKYICRGTEFLDDNPGHVQRWKDSHTLGRAMLWSTEHNRRLKGHDDLRVHSWEEVLRHVE